MGRVNYADGNGEVAEHGSHADHCFNPQKRLSKAAKESILDAMKSNPNISATTVLEFLKGLHFLQREAQHVLLT